MADWKVCGSTGLSLGDRDAEWDGDRGETEIFEYAGGEDSFDPQKAQEGFFAYDAEEPQNQTSYKLPFAYEQDGELVAMPRGIMAVAQVLEGARGGVDLPEEVQEKIRKKVEAYYQKMGDEVPW